ncbi:MAG: DNA mismatch repair ATPase MutL [Candidatus Alkanophagales archaeon MCA70_species_1]|nr:DNA mismatch repair ATPase MutL [Candidatus Alkanophaga volatiphilum]
MRGEELGKLRIGDEDYVLELLAKVHGEDVRRPIKELVENSIDAGAKNIYVAIVKGPHPHIVVNDDGEGMDERKLREIPESIARSEKRLNKEVREKGVKGVHGIGLLSTFLIGDKVEIVRKRVGSKSFKLIIYRKSKRAFLEPAEREKKGTAVYVFGIPTKSKLLSLDRVKEYLEKEFLLDVLRRGVNIRVKEVGRGGEREETITKRSLQDSSYYIINETIPTGYGNVEVKIQYNGFLKSVSVYRAGGLIADISSLKDIELSECWEREEIGGFIIADFLDLTTDKRNIVRNEKYYEFAAKIKMIEKKLEEKLKELDTKRNEEEKRKIVKELSKKFIEKLEGLGWHLPGAKVKVQKGDEAGDVVEGIGHKGVGTHGKKSHKPTIRPTHKGQDRGSLGRGISIDFVKFPPEEGYLRSKYDEQMNLILINTSHRDYIERYEKGDGAQKVDYLYKLVAKEVTLYNYGEAGREEVLERLLDLQFSMETRPPKVI